MHFSVSYGRRSQDGWGMDDQQQHRAGRIAQEWGDGGGGSTAPRTPSEQFGPLFEAVQGAELFADSKTFADAIARRPPTDIVHAFRQAAPLDRTELKAFVHANFVLPEDRRETLPRSASLQEQSGKLWQRLTRTAREPAAYDSAIALPRPFVVPGGRFREQYYWDSYFTMLGLKRSGRQDLVEAAIENMGSLLDRFGRIPNGSRSYYLSRSHPPVFYLAAGLSDDASAEAVAKRLDCMLKEHAFWMAGAEDLAKGEEGTRVVRLDDGALLNRFWDDLSVPRDESWSEDVELANRHPDRNRPELWRDIRAAAESGWDFSSRWFGADGTLGSIRTTRLLPVDLNSLLLGLEQAIAEALRVCGRAGEAEGYARAARQRGEAIAAHLWNEELGFYADHDLDTGKVGQLLTAATAFPLFCRCTDPDRADRTRNALGKLLKPFGLVTTGNESGEQWDAPNGWAPLQWIASEGLRHYGHHDLADEIAARWVKTVDAHFARSGEVLEKYDVISGEAGGGGEYEVEIGFGWTIGVTLAFQDRLTSQSGRSIEISD